MEEPQQDSAPVATLLSLPGSTTEPLSSGLRAGPSVALLTTGLHQTDALALGLGQAHCSRPDPSHLHWLRSASYVCSGEGEMGGHQECVWRLLSRQLLPPCAQEVQSAFPSHRCTVLWFSHHPMTPPRSGQLRWFPVKRVPISGLYLHWLRPSP